MADSDAAGPVGLKVADMSAVELQHLLKKVEKKTVIEDLCLDIEAGEIVALVGPSGCGKTTLLHLLAGLSLPDGGSIRFSPQTPRIGMVFQSPRLLPWRTVLENLELAAAQGEVQAPLRPLLERVGLPECMHHYPGQLSMGMQRRVALVRAFSIQPDLLLMDEPLVSLDAPTARKIQGLFLEIWEARQPSVLWVTHDLREALALADRLVFVRSSPMRNIAAIPVSVPRQERTPERLDALERLLWTEYPEIQGLI